MVTNPDDMQRVEYLLNEYRKTNDLTYEEGLAVIYVATALAGQRETVFRFASSVFEVLADIAKEEGYE